MIPLCHGVTNEDLKCSDMLWQQSRLNNHAKFHPSTKTWKDLTMLHPEDWHPSGLSCRQCFNAWKFLYDLCHHGPPYFSQFKRSIGTPEIVEVISVVKMNPIPTHAMDLPNSTVSGNLASILNLQLQGGVSDPSALPGTCNMDVCDIDGHVILFHGDLGTGEHIQAILLHWSIK
jgi:hypothetical protein